ncbi:MAG: hypothetical protein Q8M07_32785 [Prosthecobacter sp.]|nr:hypothetical protein [Prosthecobacter sp.]
MSKAIQSFWENSDAFFIDLVGTKASVYVDKETGDIVFFEGNGDDRYHGAMISPESFHGFALNLTEADEWEVLLKFGEGNSHSLGVTDSAEEATRWLRLAAAIIRAKQQAGKKTELVGV